MALFLSVAQLTSNTVGKLAESQRTVSGLSWLCQLWPMGRCLDGGDAQPNAGPVGGGRCAEPAAPEGDATMRSAGRNVIIPRGSQRWRRYAVLRES